jgi:hypothetical protein
MDELYLGPVPVDEKCEQLGENYNPDKAHKECEAYKRQLTRQFGEPKGRSEFFISRNPHEYGTYFAVEIRFDDNDSDETEFAFKVEGNLPARWDNKARIELGL